MPSLKSRYLRRVNPFSAEIDFRRQILLSEVDSRAEKVKYKWSYTHNIGIQMKRKQQAKTFVMISNWKTPFGLHGLYTNISAL